MRLRTELVVGVALAVALGTGAAALGARRARTADVDPRRSTFLAGPSGALGYAQALERLGVRVERVRRRTADIGQLVNDSTRTIVAALGSTRPLSVQEARELVELPADLLLAGRGVGAAFRCLGYRRQSTPASTAKVRAVLITRPRRSVVDSSGAADGIVTSCTGPPPLSVDTILRSRAGVGAIRLRYDGGREAVLVADDELFSNRALRETEAGPFALGLIVPKYQRIIIDEYHHGFVASGSLAGALLAWSIDSPWGWAVWQLAIVGILALVASGVRFGPIVGVIDRRRRSPLEHVRALATALAAARGHAVAVRLMVRGLRRRLSRAGQPARGDPRAWLDDLSAVVRTPEGQRAIDTLRELTDRPADAASVQRAANAVEDVWEALHRRS